MKTLKLNEEKWYKYKANQLISNYLSSGKEVYSENLGWNLEDEKYRESMVKYQKLRPHLQNQGYYSRLTYRGLFSHPLIIQISTNPLPPDIPSRKLSYLHTSNWRMINIIPSMVIIIGFIILIFYGINLDR